MKPASPHRFPGSQAGRGDGRIMQTSPQNRSAPAERTALRLYLLHVWTVFGLALSNALLGFTILASTRLYQRGSIAWRRHLPALAPATLYLLALGMSIALSQRPGISVVHVREIFVMATLVLGLVLLRGTRRVRLALDGLVVVAGASALWGLVQLLMGYGEIFNRIRGPFSHYMTFAGVLLLADLVLISQLAAGAGARRRGWWRWPVLALINLALVASLTRSAWVALFVALTVLLLLKAPRWLLAYVPAAVLFFVLAPAPVVSRVLSTVDLQDPTNYDRLCMIDAGLHMVAQRPLFGHGPGLVEVIYPIYRHPTAPRQTVPHLHHAMLQLAAERGLVALAAYVWLMGGAMLRSYRRYRAAPAEGDGSDIHLGVFVALLAFHLAGLFEDNWSDTEVQRVALFLAAIPYALGARRPIGTPPTGEGATPG